MNIILRWNIRFKLDKYYTLTHIFQFKQLSEVRKKNVFKWMLTEDIF